MRWLESAGHAIASALRRRRALFACNPRPSRHAGINFASTKRKERRSLGKVMQLYRMLIAISLAIGLVGCGETPQGAKGDPGPAGPPGARGEAGPAGPAGASGASAVRIVRANCDATGCAAQCSDDEVLLVAYCGSSRNAAIFPTERSASCRLRNP